MSPYGEGLPLLRVLGQRGFESRLWVDPSALEKCRHLDKKKSSSLHGWLSIAAKSRKAMREEAMLRNISSGHGSCSLPLHERAIMLRRMKKHNTGSKENCNLSALPVGL